MSTPDGEAATQWGLVSETVRGGGRGLENAPGEMNVRVTHSIWCCLHTPSSLSLYSHDNRNPSVEITTLGIHSKTLCANDACYGRLSAYLPHLWNVRQFCKSTFIGKLQVHFINKKNDKKRRRKMCFININLLNMAYNPLAKKLVKVRVQLHQYAKHKWASAMLLGDTGH